MAEIKTEQLDGYRRLVDIARDLASTLDLDILLSRIVHAATEITGAEAASILLYDDTSQQLYFQVSTNMDDSMQRGLLVPLEGSIAGWIVTNRKTVRIKNVHEDERFFSKVEKTTGFSTKSMLGIPLVTKNKIVGVLEALNKQGGFSETDESMLLVLGAQAAVAIENARLFQQSDLIAEFVHELRTPLASLSTATYLLLRPEMSQDQRDQIITNIHNETMRLNALASSFLDLARLESGRVQFHKSTFSVADLMYECKDVMSSKATEDHIQIRVESPEGLPLLEADRDKMKQVFLNLISNAVKYNRPNGSVILRAEVTDDDEMNLQVQDTGVGIPESSLPHLFEKFYRVRENESRVSGTGLGLSICKQIIHGHNGRVEVKSKSGIGTVFSIFLPRHNRAQTNIIENKEDKKKKKKK